MIEELIISGIGVIILILIILTILYLASVIKRKTRKRRLDELHARKMQVLEEIQKELEVEALEQKAETPVEEDKQIAEVPKCEN